MGVELPIFFIFNAALTTTIKQINTTHSSIIACILLSLKISSRAVDRLKLSKAAIPPVTKKKNNPPDMVVFGFFAFFIIQKQQVRAASMEAAHITMYKIALSGLNRLMTKLLLR